MLDHVNPHMPVQKRCSRYTRDFHITWTNWQSPSIWLHDEETGERERERETGETAPRGTGHIKVGYCEGFPYLSGIPITNSQIFINIMSDKEDGLTDETSLDGSDEEDEPTRVTNLMQDEEDELTNKEGLVGIEATAPDDLRNVTDVPYKEIEEGLKDLCASYVFEEFPFRNPAHPMGMFRMKLFIGIIVFLIKSRCSFLDGSKLSRKSFARVCKMLGEALKEVWSRVVEAKGGHEDMRPFDDSIPLNHSCEDGCKKEYCYNYAPNVQLRYEFHNHMGVYYFLDLMDFMLKRDDKDDRRVESEPGQIVRFTVQGGEATEKEV